jgi:hypothetical protein
MKNGSHTCRLGLPRRESMGGSFQQDFYSEGRAHFDPKALRKRQGVKGSKETIFLMITMTYNESYCYFYGFML